MGFSMSLWLPKRLNKRQIFVLQLASIVLVIHFLLVGCYLWRSGSKVLTINMRMSTLDFSRPIVVIPYMRRTGQLQKLVQAQNVGQGRKKNQRLRVPTKKVVQPPVKSKNQLVKQDKKAPVKKNIGKKPLEPIKEKIAEPVLEPKKPEPKKEVVAKEPVVIPDQVLKPIVAEPEISSSETVSLTEEEPIVIGQEEFEAMHLYQEIHQSLTHQWHPPAGLHPKQSAIVLITVDLKGIISDIVIEQSSGVLVYDMAARMAVYGASLPQQAWNNKIRIHF